MSDEAKYVRLTTPVGRITFPNVFEAVQIEMDGRKSGDPKFRVGILIPKTGLSKDEQVFWDNMRLLVTKVAHEEFGDTLPDNFRSPFIDGDKQVDKDDNPIAHSAGCWLARATTKKQPKVLKLVDKRIQPVDEETDIYGGCYAALSINFFPYKVGRNTGVSMSFDRILKIKDGTPLEGGDKRSDNEVFGSYVTEGAGAVKADDDIAF